MKPVRFLAAALVAAALVVIPTQAAHGDVLGVRFTVSVDNVILHPGEEVTWTVDVTNTTPGNAQFLLLFSTAVIDEYAEITSFTPGIYDGPTETIVYQANLDQNASTTFTILATVDANAAPGSQLIGIATVDTIGPMCEPTACHVRSTVAGAIGGGDPDPGASPADLPKTGLRPDVVATVGGGALLAGAGALAVAVGRRRKA